MAVLSRLQVVRVAQAAGVPPGFLAIAGAVCEAESGRNTDAQGVNGPTSGCPRGSVDLGLWQINNCYHSFINRWNWRDPAQNAKAMMSVSGGGVNWHPWTTYDSGAYRRSLATYEALVNSPALGGGGTVTSPPPAPAPPAAFRPIGSLATLVRQGFPLFKAVLLTFEQLSDHIAASVYGDSSHRTDAGSRFF